MARMELITSIERRRRWSDDVKLRILAEAEQPGACIGDVARRPLGGQRSKNAIWTYETPYAAVAAIKDHLAFYPDRVDSISIQTA